VGTMEISDRAKKFILKQFKSTNTNAISIVLSYGCCGGGTVHMAYIKKSDNGHYRKINDIDVDISGVDLDNLCDLLLDSDGKKIILKTIKYTNENGCSL